MVVLREEEGWQVAEQGTQAGGLVEARHAPALQSHPAQRHHTQAVELLIRHQHKGHILQGRQRSVPSMFQPQHLHL